MTSKNTTNYKFLKNFKPELFKLAEKMEEDLLVTPVSILAYATRFLEYILYDIAKDNKYKVNRESGFVNNIYELIQLDYLEYYLEDLMIKAYVFRNKSIHNTNIVQSLKDDKKTAHEMNRRLFDIADVYYKNLTNNYEEHTYIEPTLADEAESEISTIARHDKVFDKCIVCGESTKFSKSNFCQEHDNLLNYREVLTNKIHFPTNMVCPKCGKGIVEVILNNFNWEGKRTKYVRCSNCDYDGGTYPASLNDVKYVKKCPKCTRGVLVRQGDVLRCSLNYHEMCEGEEPLILDEEELKFDYE